MDPLVFHTIVEQHVRSFFANHFIREKHWTKGPAKERLPNLRVLEIEPGPRSALWTYVTRGASEANPLKPLEYLMLSDRPRTRFVELLTIVAYYALGEDLGAGHIVPIGEPLVPNSQCEHVYLSLPYPFGNDLEVFSYSGGHGHVLWVFPITPAERNLLLESGVDALETRFEGQHVEYWSPFRPSVV